MMETTVTKRTFLVSAASRLGGLAVGGCSKKSGAAVEASEVTKSPEQWRAILTSAQFAVLRNENTERPRSSPLNDEHRRDTYQCARCALPIFASTAKFESGTGWPSFTVPIEDAVKTRSDPGLFGARTEVHCRRCGEHLGHVFDDGPPPNGRRYCRNGLAMEFVTA